MKFYKGDTLIALKSDEHNGNHKGQIVKGRRYIVTNDTHKSCVNVDEQLFGFFANKFKLVSRAFGVGDTVRVVCDEPHMFLLCGEVHAKSLVGETRVIARNDYEGNAPLYLRRYKRPLLEIRPIGIS